MILRTFQSFAKKIWRRKKDISQISAGGYAVFGIMFFLQIAIARLLGAEKFGTYTATYALVTLVEVPLVSRGSEIALRLLGSRTRNREIEGHSYLKSRMIRQDISLYICAYLAIALIAFIWHNELGIDPLLLTILGLMLPAQIGYGLYKSYFTIFGQMAALARFEVTYVVCLAGISLFGLYVGGLYGLAVGMVAGAGIKTVLAYVFSRRFVANREITGLSSFETVSLVQEGAFPIARNIFANGLNQIDIILLAALHRPEIVGFYKVGKSLSSVPIKLAHPVWRYLQPTLLRATHNDDRQLRITILSGAAVMAIGLVFVFPLVGLYGRELVNVLYGEGYEASYGYLLVLLVGMWIFHGLGGWFKFWATVTNARWYGIKVYGIACSCLIAVGLLVGSVSPIAMAYVYSAILISITLAIFLKIFAEQMVLLPKRRVTEK